MEEVYVDLVGMIEIQKDCPDTDEESGDLVKFCRENGVKIGKFPGAGWGDHRFTGSKKALNKIKKTWYPEEV